MTARACPDCGVLEQRVILPGKESVNLEPYSGLCVDCLVKAARRLNAGKPAFDAKMARAEREE